MEWIELDNRKVRPDFKRIEYHTNKIVMCLSVCILRLREQLDGFAQLFLEVVGEVQGSVR